jgi:adenine/guanine phosphoribosyltransferase-like PRPP-binding protein
MAIRRCVRAAASPTVVVSAAVGGIVLGYEVARQLGTKAIFVEKDAGVRDAAPQLCVLTPGGPCAGR